MYYVYVLKSEKDGKLYIGQTSSVEDRIRRHNSGVVIATRSRRPLKLISFRGFGTRAEAVRMEKFLKSLKGGNGFKKILNHWGVAKW